MAGPGGAGQHDTVIGMTIMAGAALLLPLGDTFAKALTTVMSPVHATMWRLLAQGVMMVPLAFLLRRRLHGPMFSPIVALSGLLLMLTLAAFLGAFERMPIATAIAIFFVEPLVLTLLAVPFLGERIGLPRLIAVAVGLLGAVIVIRPGLATFGIAAVFPLGAAVTFSLNMIVLRHASKRRSGLTIQCGATAYAAVGTIIGLMIWQGPSSIIAVSAAVPLWTWGAIAGAGATAAICFVMIAEAFRRVEAGILAPFQYLEIIGATFFGYVVFGDFPDALTWLGVAIILGAGLYVFYREHRGAD